MDLQGNTQATQSTGDILRQVKAVASERFTISEIDYYIDQMERNNMQMLQDMPQLKGIGYDLTDVYRHVSANESMIYTLKQTKTDMEGLN